MSPLFPADAERIPRRSLLLGYGAIAPLIALAVANLTAPQPLLLEAARLWGASILLFLAGVARGLSFFTPGGPRPLQIAVSLLRFALGVASLWLPLSAAFAALLIGYATVALADPVLARRQAAPDFFRRLRPLQMALTELALLILLTVSLAM